MKKLTLMMMVPDRARADVMLTADRVFYGFATEASTEDGDLPGPGDGFSALAAAVVDALAPREGEERIAPEQLRVNLYVDNVKQALDGVSEGAIRRVAEALSAFDPVFDFLGRF